MKKEYKEIIVEIILFHQEILLDASNKGPGEWNDDNVDAGGWV